MNNKSDLDKLAILSETLLERQLADLRRVSALRVRSLTQLQDLIAPQAVGLDPVNAAITELRYNQWADARRSEINQNLATQTAQWMQARADAAHALGRIEVLRKLSKRLARRQA